jgi:phosphoenolpyruvate carboxykinase (ATP)
LKIDTQREKLITAASDSDDVKVLKTGALVVNTGDCTGRSPNAKSIVVDNITRDKVDWDNNSKLTVDDWSELFLKARKFELDNEIHKQTLYAGRDEKHQLQLTVKTSKTWQALFANNMFVRERSRDAAPKEAWELMCFPEMEDTPTVAISFMWKKIIITGTHYAGEIKKSIFTVLNFILPDKEILPMHCSVNTDLSGQNSAIFFGLSGTGKTTLSASEDRVLIGDDEHGWSDTGLFNFEGGCYAKVINLSEDSEPEIWHAVQQHGATLENVVVSDSGAPMFDRSDHTENTRGSYPIEHIKNASRVGTCGHPNNIIFLTCDAFGVLPPVSKLSTEEAVQHFLLGYTAKVAGTEAGVTEPVMTFSHCFGAPFMPRKPKEYANILRKNIIEHGVDCWLVNTGWSGGPYGTGDRMPISVSREVVDQILSGKLSEASFVEHVHTGLNIPASTSSALLNSYLVPEESWEVIDIYNPGDDDDYDFRKPRYVDKASYLMEEWSKRINAQEGDSEA